MIRIWPIAAVFLAAGCASPTAEVPHKTVVAESVVAEPIEPASVQAPAAPAAEAPTPAPTPPKAPAPDPRDVFPHIRVDVGRRLVEIAGEVPIDVRGPTPRVYLEVLVCARDTKEHEALVVTDARASHVHGALLLVGLQPGTPGVWRWDGVRPVATPPTGDGIDVLVAWRDASGQEREAPLASWAESTSDGATLDAAGDPNGFCFAGSVMARQGGGEVYRADIDGTIVGLTAFGGETVAWRRMESPESGVKTPHWIAKASIPPAGTPVVVRLRAR